MLFRKYVLIFSTLVGGALVASGAIELFFYYRDTRATRAEMLRNEANAAVQAISLFFGGVERQLRAAVQPLDDASALAQRRLDALRLLNHVPAVTEVAWIDRTGREQVRVSRFAPDVIGGAADRSADSVFTETRGGNLFASGMYVRRSKPHLVLAVREPGVGGVLTAEVDLAFVSDLISGIRVGESGNAYVVDGAGMLVAHPDRARPLRMINLASTPHIAAALAEPRAGTSRPGLSVARWADGRQALSTYAHLEHPAWIVFVEQPRREAYAPIYAGIVRIGFFLLAGLGLALVSSLFLARRMVTPIQALRSGAARIGAGDLDETINLATGDEIEELAHEFNRMTARLRESYATLEQKVADRTQQLDEKIAENMRMLRELEEKSGQLEESSRHKSQFLANMSHELRTPLNAVIGFSEVLREQMFGELNERQLDYVGDILTSGRHLLSLINDILDLSKVEAGRMELELGSVDLAAVLDSGVMMVRERAGNHGIRLTHEIDPSVGAIEADERKLKQIVFNLLSNAVKFTPDGGAVHLSARLEGPEVQVSVRDTGIGIPLEDQERIFEPFRQATRRGTQEGTGLGLGLVRSFVELHGGRIWAESAPDSGSCFTFTLPLRRHAATPLSAGADLPRVAAPSDEWPVVLLVEDDRKASDLIAAYLEGVPVNLVVRRDGESGLEAARDLRPAAIILDIVLPQMDGWEVLARLKEDAATASIPTIVVTGLDEQAKGFALGAAEYMVKPVPREQLISALGRLAGPEDANGSPLVLAVDDDPMALSLLKAILEPAGCIVLGALSGEDGIRLAQEQQPALLILDLLMPGMDGPAVIDQLRADASTADIPILVLSSKTMSAADKQRLRAQVADIAHKSEFERDRFVELVRRLCRRS